MANPVFHRFLGEQHAEVEELLRATALVQAVPLEPYPTQHWLARFLCSGRRRESTGEVVPASDFLVQIWFDEDYLRHADSLQNLRFAGPKGTWHPNVSATLPLICIGFILPGTPLVELLERTHEVLSYQRFTCDERTSLNREACSFARSHESEFPTDARPLRAARFEFQLEAVATVAR